MSGNTKTAIILILFCIILMIFPLALHRDSDFAGSDDHALELIEELEPNYQPWATSMFEPTGGEVEAFLFSVQAAAGAAFLGYAFGRLHHRSKQQPATQE